MTDYSKITALYSRLSVGDEDRDGGESNSIQNQKIFLENYARGQHLTNIRHYIDDDESGRFFDRSAYSRMIEDVESGKIGVCIMKDLTRWGRDYLQVGNAMEIFRRNNVRFIAVNNGIDSEKPDTLEFAPFINIMSEWYAKDISKKVKTGIKTKGMSGKPIVTEAPYGYVKDPDNKDFWIIDEEAAAVVRLIFRLFIGGKNRNQIAVYLTQEKIPTPTFYMKDRGRGTCKNKTLNEDNRCKWNKVTLTHILTRQEYCGDVVNFKTTKHFRDKHNHYVDRSQWHITENVHEPIICRSDFETVQRILENAPVRRPNGDGEIHPLSGLLFCKDCGAKMHIRIDYRNGGKRHVAYCSEYHKGKAKNPKCHSPHIMDADLLMQTIAEVLKKIEDDSISNRAEFEALVKKNLAMQQTDQTKKQQKRIPQITTRLEQIDKVLNKLYEDNALGTIPQDRYEQMSQKYSEEYYALKAELATLQEQLSAYENAGGRAQKFLKLTERHAAFTDLTPAILNEFISRIEVHERDQKRARYDSFRGKKEQLKARQENSSLAQLAQALGTPTHPVEDAGPTALLQIINQLRPVVIVDESHHARSTLSNQMLRDFNPRFVLDLTATPRYLCLYPAHQRPAVQGTRPVCGKARQGQGQNLCRVGRTEKGQELESKTENRHRRGHSAGQRL